MIDMQCAGCEGVVLRSQMYAKLARNFAYPEESGDEEDSARMQAMQSAYLTSFDLAISKEACSLNEASYASAAQDSVFEELVRFYDYFGLKRTLDAELPDHLRVELEFMHFLTYLEHQARECLESIDGLLLAQRDFIERHLLIVVRGIANSYRGGDDYYARSVQALSEFVEGDFAYLCDAVTGRNMNSQSDIFSSQQLAGYPKMAVETTGD